MLGGIFMDAIEATYQALPIVEGARESAEKESVIFDEVIDTAKVVKTEEGASFEEVMVAMFDVAIDAGDVAIALADGGDVALLHEDIASKDGELVADSSLLKFLDRNEGREKIEISDMNVSVEAEEISSEVLPFVELELDVAEKSDIFEEVKKSNTATVTNVGEKNKEKQENEEITYMHEGLLADALPVQQKQVEHPKKLESKKDDELENQKDMEQLEVRIPSKQKKVQPKKLPIVVEDLRSIEEAMIADVAGSSSGENIGDDETSSYCKITSENVMSSSESFSVSEGQGASNEGRFVSILAEQIKANSAELVERGKIVLRDGNVGEIRLQLKPAYLGNVRIQLKVSGDKKMEGEVTVSSKEAFDAFEESMQELVASFNEAGFDASGFNLNWQGGEKEEIIREDLSNQYFSPEKTHLSLSRRLNFADNVYGLDKAKQLNVLA